MISKAILGSSREEVNETCTGQTGLGSYKPVDQTGLLKPNQVL